MRLHCSVMLLQSPLIEYTSPPVSYHIQGMGYVKNNALDRGEMAAPFVHIQQLLYPLLQADIAAYKNRDIFYAKASLTNA